MRLCLKKGKTFVQAKSRCLLLQLTCYLVIAHLVHLEQLIASGRDSLDGSTGKQPTHIVTVGGRDVYRPDASLSLTSILKNIGDRGWSATSTFR